MPPIPRNIGRQVLPSGRVGAVFAPADIADVGQGIEARGLGALGQGISQLGLVLGRIEQAEGVSQAATARAQANAEIKGLELNLKDNNDTATYQSRLDQALETIEGFRPKNQTGSKLFDDFLAESISGWEVGVLGLRLEKTQSLAEGAYISNKASAIARGDLVEVQAVVQGAVDTGVITPEKAAKDLAGAPAQIVEFSVNTILNNASQFTTDGDLVNAVIEIAKAESILNDPDAKLDPAKEKTLRSAINTNKQKIKVRKTIQQQDNADDFLVRISEDVDTASIISELETALKADRITGSDFASLKTNSLSVITVDDQRAIDSVTTAISQVGDDTLPLADAKKILRENASKLKNETVSGFTKDLNREFDKSTDTAHSRVRKDVRSRAVGRSESLLDRLIELLASAEVPSKRRPLEDRITTEREKFNLELDNFNRWEASLRAWRRKNLEATPEQIQKEGIRAWRTDFSDKTIEQLRDQTKLEKEGNERVLMKKPDGEEVLLRSDQVDRAIKEGWSKI